MPIDPSVALGARAAADDFAWTAVATCCSTTSRSARAPTRPTRASCATTIEDGLQVLPTFAVVAQTVHRFEPPAVEYPGISIDLAKVLHGTQRIDVHRPLPTDGTARAVARVSGGLRQGQRRGRSRPRRRSPTSTARRCGRTRRASSPAARAASAASAARPGRPGRPTASRTPVHRDADACPQQALWYRLLGDRNPLHSDPAFAASGRLPAADPARPVHVRHGLQGGRRRRARRRRHAGGRLRRALRRRRLPRRDAAHLGVARGRPAACWPPRSTSATAHRRSPARELVIARMNVRALDGRAAEVETWADEADVVVVGFGAAGAAAAYEAASAGADDARARPGRRGRRRGGDVGRVHLPRRRHARAARGRLRRTRVENMTRFLTAACGPAPDEAKIDAVLRAQPRAPRVAGRPRRRVPRHASCPTPNGTSPVDGEGLMLHRRRERATPTTRSPRRRRAGTSCRAAGPGGAVLMRRARRGRARRRRPRRRTTPGPSALVVDDGGRVVRRGRDAGTARRSRSGPAPASCSPRGGFINSPEMVDAVRAGRARHAAAARHRRRRRARRSGWPQAVGARLKRMDAIECALPFNAPRSLVHGIIVNRLGQRFVNEDTYQGRVGQTALLHHDGAGVPDRRRGALRAELAQRPRHLGVRDRRRTRARDRPAGRLADRHARLLQRARRARRRSAVPQAGAGAHAAARRRWPRSTCARDKFIYAPFTLGGLHTDVDGAVLDLDGEPIPGLYAAGRTHVGRRRAGLRERAVARRLDLLRPAGRPVARQESKA